MVEQIASPAAKATVHHRSNIPITTKRKKMPDFAKLHAQQFNKMDTLDSYLEKKKERANALTPGPKSAKKSTTMASGSNITAVKPIPAPSIIAVSKPVAR